MGTGWVVDGADGDTQRQGRAGIPPREGEEEIASGRSHSIATLAAAEYFVVRAAVDLDPVAGWTAVGLFVGLVLTPDLDQDGKNISDFFIRSLPDFIREIFPILDKPVNYLGYFIGKAWELCSWPYGWIFSHRSFWTHFPIVGTMIRIAYFLWPLYYFGYIPPPAFINGLVIADTAHWLMDSKLLRRIFVQ